MLFAETLGGYLQDNPTPTSEQGSTFCLVWAHTTRGRTQPAACETAIDEVESPAAHIAPLEISPITLANPTQGFSLLEGPH